MSMNPPPPPPPPPPSYPGAGMPSGVPAPGGQNQKATWSLVLGILGIICCGFFAAIPAMILGRQAKSEIVASGGAQTGEGMAQAGFILGIVGIVLSVLGIIVWVLLFIFGAASGSYSGQYG